MILKFTITAGLATWLLSRVDYDNTRKIFLLIKPQQIAIAVFLHTGTFLLGALRWWLLLGYAGISQRFGNILPSYYLGLFFNNILPTGVGGDVVRSLRLNLKGLNVETLLGSAIMDRVIGLVAVLLMGTVSLFLSPDIHLTGRERLALLFVIGVVVLGLWMLSSRRVLALIQSLTEKYHYTRIRRTFLKTMALCCAYGAAKKLFLQAFIISLIAQSLVILVYFYLGRSIGLTLSILTYFSFIPIVFVASSLPISIGGLGVREGVLVGLLVGAHVTTELGIALSLLYLLVLWISSLPGAIVMLAAARNKKE